MKPGDRVRIKTSIKNMDEWNGLEAKVITGKYVTGFTPLELDKRFNRPDGFDSRFFFWFTNDLEVIDSADYREQDKAYMEWLNIRCETLKVPNFHLMDRRDKEHMICFTQFEQYREYQDR